MATTANTPQSIATSGITTGLPAAVGDGWHLVARIAPTGGMFDGNSNLSSDYSFGSYSNDPYTSTDFYRPFPIEAGEILFVTGDNQYWARTNYAELKETVNAKSGDYSASY